MIPTIPRERLLAPIDPVKDFQAGKTEILLDQHPSHWETLRDAVVRSNFSRTEPSVLYCPKLTPANIHRFPPASKWEISKLVVAKMRSEGTLWTTVAILVCTVVALLGLSKLALWYIARQKERLAAGGWYVYTYSNGFLTHSRPFSQTDVTMAYFEVGVYGLLTLFVSFIPIITMVENVQKAYEKVRQDTASSEAGQVHVLRIEKRPSSGTALADSLGKNETMKNILSQEDLSRDQIKAPRMIAVGRYVTNVRGMVLRVLERTPQTPQELRHPFENRAMTPAEQEKFLTDCANIFSIDDREKILACWKAKAPLEAVNKAMSIYADIPRADMEKHLDGLWRNWTFMGLLPVNAWVDSCKDWPLPPREVRLENLSEPSFRRQIQELSDFMDPCLEDFRSVVPNLFD